MLLCPENCMRYETWRNRQMHIITIYHIYIYIYIYMAASRLLRCLKLQPKTYKFFQLTFRWLWLPLVSACVGQGPPKRFPIKFQELEKYMFVLFISFLFERMHAKDSVYNQWFELHEHGRAQRDIFS